MAQRKKRSRGPDEDGQARCRQDHAQKAGDQGKSKACCDKEGRYYGAWAPVAAAGRRCGRNGHRGRDRGAGVDVRGC